MQLVMYAPELEKMTAYYVPEGFKMEGPVSQKNMDSEHKLDWCRACINSFGVESADEKFFNERMRIDEGHQSNDIFYIRTAEGEAAGTASARINKTGLPFLHYIAVNPMYRGKGLSRPLIYAAAKRHIELGFTYSYLTTDDFRINAVAVYLKMGYRPVLCSDDAEERWSKLLRILSIEECTAYNFKEDEQFPQIEHRPVQINNLRADN